MHEILEKGTACDIARAASGLHDRANELLTSDVTKRTVGYAEVTFVREEDKKTFGKLRFSKFIFVSIVSLLIALAIV